MADLKLTKAELAALDLLIADLQEQKVRVRLPRTTFLARVTATLVRITPRATPYILDAIGGPIRRGGKLRAYGKDLPANLSLQDLIDLRDRSRGS